MKNVTELEVGRDYMGTLFGAANCDNGNKKFIYRGGISFEVVNNGQSKIVKAPDMVAAALKKLNQPGIHMGM